MLLFNENQDVVIKDLRGVMVKALLSRRIKFDEDALKVVINFDEVVREKYITTTAINKNSSLVDNMIDKIDFLKPCYQVMILYKGAIMLEAVFKDDKKNYSDYSTDKQNITWSFWSCFCKTGAILNIAEANTCFDEIK